MTKKNRKRTLRLSPTQLAQPGVSTPATRQETESVRPVTPALSDLRQEYHYVLRDLKTIGIIAAAMLVVMVVVLLLI